MYGIWYIVYSDLIMMFFKKIIAFSLSKMKYVLLVK